jgi:Tol biopolymer transport system component
MSKLTKIRVISIFSILASLTLSALFVQAHGDSASADFTPAKKFEPLGAGGFEGTSYIINLKTGKVHVVGTNRDHFRKVGVSTDGKWLVGCGSDFQSVYVQNIAGGHSILMGKVSNRIDHFDWEASSKSFIVYYDEHTHHKRKRFYLSRPGKPQELSAIYHDNRFEREYSPDRKYYAAFLPGTMVIKYADSGKEVRRFTADIYDLSWSIDSKHLYFRQAITNGNDQYNSWNVDGNQVNTLATLTDNNVMREYSPNGKWYLESKLFGGPLYLARVDGKMPGRIVSQVSPGESISRIDWLRDGYNVLVDVCLGE